MQPQLKPIPKKFQDYRNKHKEEGLKAIAEMQRQPYTLAQAEANLDKLRAERLTARLFASALCSPLSLFALCPALFPALSNNKLHLL
ncbi:MAG: hypothetical protein RL660_873 [Bacteroidota bacterium]|jgi:hypothetical protein